MVLKTCLAVYIGDLMQVLDMVNHELPKKVWGVSKGVGSFLNFEIGKQNEIKLASGTMDKQGDLHFWVYLCSWELLQDGKKILDSNSIPTQSEHILTSCLDGKNLERLTANDDFFEIVLCFSNNINLRLHDSRFNYEDDDNYMIIYFNPSRNAVCYNRDNEFYYVEKKR